MLTCAMTRAVSLQLQISVEFMLGQVPLFKHVFGNVKIILNNPNLTLNL